MPKSQQEWHIFRICRDNFNIGDALSPRLKLKRTNQMGAHHSGIPPQQRSSAPNEFKYTPSYSFMWDLLPNAARATGKLTLQIRWLYGRKVFGKQNGFPSVGIQPFTERLSAHYFSGIFKPHLIVAK